jgi:hypothetical protein
MTASNRNAQYEFKMMTDKAAEAMGDSRVSPTG